MANRTCDNRCPTPEYDSEEPGALHLRVTRNTWVEELGENTEVLVRWVDELNLCPRCSRELLVDYELDDWLNNAPVENTDLGQRRPGGRRR